MKLSDLQPGQIFVRKSGMTDYRNIRIKPDRILEVCFTPTKEGQSYPYAWYEWGANLSVSALLVAQRL